jgi:predicted DNA-binding transcriptional regulator YafY
MAETFHPKKDIDFSERFNNIIGISNPEKAHSKIEDIVLSFDSQQGMYFKSLPWHSSFNVLVDNEDEFRVCLNIIPNDELFQRILMYSDSVKVVSPEWLKDRIKEVLSEALENYS